MNYQNSKIYKIVCNVTGLQYIGSTSMPRLSTRLCQHRCDYKRYLNNKYNFVSSFDILKNGNYNIILIENFPCQSKEQLYARERYHINNTECVNKIKRVGIKNELGKQEYSKQQYINNRERIAKQQKMYKDNNREKLKKYYKQYYLNKKLQVQNLEIKTEHNVNE
jgi:hypothetical protein